MRRIHFTPAEPGSGRPAHLRSGPDDARALLLFVHGFPDSARVWEPLMERLPESCRSIAPFAPGTDGTPPSSRAEFDLGPRRAGMLDLLNDVDSVATDRIVIVAHDLGGALVEPLRLALGPRVVGSVYLNSLTLQQFWKRKTRLSQLLRSLYVFAFQLPFLDRPRLERIGARFRGRIYDLGRLPKDDAMRAESNDVLWGIESYRRYFPEVMRLVRRPVEPSPLPTLFLGGERDPFILPVTRSEAQRFCERPQVVTLDAGHWPQRSHPAEVASHLTAFLGSLGIGRSGVEAQPRPRSLPPAPAGQGRAVTEPELGRTR